MKFEFVTAEKFFELLYRDKDFTSGLGAVMLAAGMLETNLRCYMITRKIKKIGEKTTLGIMVDHLKKQSLLSCNGEMHFDDLVLKRNYLAHSLFDLFSKEIEESMLPRSELVEMDVEIFSEKVKATAEDFLHFAKIVKNADTNETLLL